MFVSKLRVQATHVNPKGSEQILTTCESSSSFAHNAHFSQNSQYLFKLGIIFLNSSSSYSSISSFAFFLKSMINFYFSIIVSSNLGEQSTHLNTGLLSSTVKKNFSTTILHQSHLTTLTRNPMALLICLITSYWQRFFW